MIKDPKRDNQTLIAWHQKTKYEKYLFRQPADTEMDTEVTSGHEGPDKHGNTKETAKAVDDVTDSEELLLVTAVDPVDIVPGVAAVQFCTGVDFWYLCDLLSFFPLTTPNFGRKLHRKSGNFTKLTIQY